MGWLLAASGAVDSCGFEKVPLAALTALQESRGKSFTAGAVFVNGKYIVPPYVVSRYGTALMVNGHQVSGPLVPWSKFLAASRPAVAAPSASASDASSETVQEASSVDELFDEPAASASAPAAAASEAKFVTNVRTRRLLQDIDKQRASLDKSLRLDHFYFFSPRYASVGGDLKTLDSMMARLPDELRAAESAEDLFSRLRRAGLGFVSMEVCTDLYANRLTFPALFELRKRVHARRLEQKELEANTGAL